MFRKRLQTVVDESKPASPTPSERIDALTKRVEKLETRANASLYADTATTTDVYGVKSYVPVVRFRHKVVWQGEPIPEQYHYVPSAWMPLGGELYNPEKETARALANQHLTNAIEWLVQDDYEGAEQ